MPPVIHPAAFPKDTDTALPPGASGLLCSSPGPRTLIYPLVSLLPLQITFEISKQEDWQIPIWIIVGSTLGGLLLLALLVLALWKVRGPHRGAVGSSILAAWPMPGIPTSGLCGQSPSSELACCHSTQPITTGWLATRGHSTYGFHPFVGPFENLMRAKVPLIRKKACAHHKMSPTKAGC